ncbi:MAG: hypothetical protein Q8N63_01670 [Nanoarchaeota archaeon]|nr:hypothetical protein [Nanoarchaeota archaeon]
MTKFSFKNLKVELKRQLNPSSLKKQFLELIKGIEKKDIVLMLILPILITLIMILPLSIRTLLQLNIKNPIWWQYLTQSFVHNSWSHLSSNLFGYFLYSLLILIFVNKLKLKREFYKLFLFLVISLPIVSSIIQVRAYPIVLSWLPNLQHSAGTSGIVSALAGFMIIFWAVYFNKINKEIVFDVRTSLFFMIYIALLFVFYYSKGISDILILVLILFFIFLLTLISNIKKILIEISKESKIGVILTFFLITTPILFFMTPKIIFPSFNSMFNNGTFIDFFMHYIGIVYGIIVCGSYFIFLNKRWRD